MRVKTSITLTPDAIAAVDELVGPGGSRSRVIEEAIFSYVAHLRRGERERRDLGILNGAADELNREMADVLEYQADA